MNLLMLTNFTILSYRFNMILKKIMSQIICDSERGLDNWHKMSRSVAVVNIAQLWYENLKWDPKRSQFGDGCGRQLNQHLKIPSLSNVTSWPKVSHISWVTSQNKKIGHKNYYVKARGAYPIIMVDKKLQPF